MSTYKGMLWLDKTKQNQVKRSKWKSNNRRNIFKDLPNGHTTTTQRWFNVSTSDQRRLDAHPTLCTGCVIKTIHFCIIHKSISISHHLNVLNKQKYVEYIINEPILTLLLLNTTCPVLANSVDPDQLASEEANWSGSALFVIKYVNFYQKPGSSNLIGWKLEVGVAS